MSAWLRWLAVLLLVLLALAAAGWFAAGPWLAPPIAAPEHIAGTWAQVESWAAETRHPDAPIDRLHAALDHLKRAGRSEETWEPSRPPEPVSDPAEQQALAALVEWSEHGGLGSELCIVDPADLSAGPARVVEMLRLARLALAHARDDTDPAFAAALRLGAYLRGRGPLIAGAVGFAVAGDALQVAEARNLPAGPAFKAFAPRREEVLPILAREAVCSLRLAEAAFRSGAGQPADMVEPGVIARWSATWIGPERELAMARWYLGERVAAAAAAGDDLTAVAATQVVPDEPDALPASLLVRSLAASGASVVTDMQATLTAYAARLGPPP
ncbi:hypothetical protein [Nannocystis punicea]|uniref:Uncharacterized protein n=1 Tax=Nannocystis punicea TaxID=2995304 RepID=A0ABY7HCQ7_9BACT|nr:hypothetical protein [Nannocystis poenicansa]WAS97049.1 hypothetical protein O0S08_12950 [Nannocystis poenicansa]